MDRSGPDGWVAEGVPPRAAKGRRSIPPRHIRHKLWTLIIGSILYDFPENNLDSDPCFEAEYT
jgi:hypothetical protein